MGDPCPCSPCTAGSGGGGRRPQLSVRRGIRLPVHGGQGALGAADGHRRLWLRGLFLHLHFVLHWRPRGLQEAAWLVCCQHNPQRGREERVQFLLHTLRQSQGARGDRDRDSTRASISSLGSGDETWSEGSAGGTCLKLRLYCKSTLFTYIACLLVGWRC